MSSSRPDTWMPLYIGDYLKDTMHLTTEEHGAYLLLIMHYWMTGQALQNDANGLQLIARIKPSRVSRKTIETIKQFFVAKEGLLYHPRIEKEITNALDNKEKRRRQTEAARAVKLGNTSQGNTCETNSVTESVSTLVTGIPSPSSSPCSEDKPSSQASGSDADRKKPLKFILPEWVPKTEWDDFIVMRNRMRKPMTDKAKALTITDLDKLRSQGHDPAAVLLQSVKKSWQGLFELKGEQHGNSQGNASTGGYSAWGNRPTKSERLHAAARRAAAAGGYASDVGQSGETGTDNNAGPVFRRS